MIAQHIGCSEEEAFSTRSYLEMIRIRDGYSMLGEEKKKIAIATPTCKVLFLCSQFNCQEQVCKCSKIQESRKPHHFQIIRYIPFGLEFADQGPLVWNRAPNVISYLVLVYLSFLVSNKSCQQVPLCPS